MTFDAVGIEHAFAKLTGSRIGSRGEPFDADFFRGGNPQNLAKALSAAVDAIESRAKSVKFVAKDSEPGGPKARLDVAISRLRSLVQKMASSKVVEREDYHWEIIGGLVYVIDALLDKVADG